MTDCSPARLARQLSIDNRQLLIAAGKGNVDQVSYLLERGAKVNFADADGNTALHWAAGEGQKDVITDLVERKDVLISVENGENKTALDVAWKRGDIEIFEMLGEKITADARRTIDEYYEKMKPKPRPTSTSLTFSEATSNGDYDFAYSSDDIQNILEFLGQPLPTDSSEEFQICVTFDLGPQGMITLLYSSEGKRYFKFKTVETVGTVEFKTSSNFIRRDVKRTDEADWADTALQKVRNVCEWLKTRSEKNKENKEKNKKKKGTTTVEKKSRDNLEGELDNILTKAGNDLEDKKRFRQFFASCLNEMSRTRRKVKKCTEILQNLIKEEPTEFTFKAAVTFVLCFETFAAMDTFTDIKLQEKEKTLLKQMKKGYCSRLYPELDGPDAKCFLDLFQEWRGRLVKTDGKNIIRKDDFKSALTGQVIVKKVLEDFLEFSLTVDANITSKSREDKREDFSLKDFASFLDSSQKEFSNLATSTTAAAEDNQSFFYHFSANTREFLGSLEKQDVMYELLFDLMVNVCPQIQVNSGGLESEKVHKLRNVVVHDFQNETKAHIREELPLIILHLYRLQLAEKINAILLVFRDENADKRKTIEEKFNNALKDVDDNFVNFSFSGQLEQPFIQYDRIKRERVELFTKIYIKFLAPLIDRPLESEDDDGLMSAQIGLTALSGHQIRQFCEQFFILEQLTATNRMTEVVSYEKILQKQLQEKLKLDENQARYTTEKPSSAANEAFESDISHIVNSLLSLVKVDDSKKNLLTYNDLLSLTKQAKTSTTRFSFEKHEACLNHRKLTMEEKLAIENVLPHLPDDKQEKEIEYGDEKINVNVYSVVSHLLSMFVEVHEACQIKIDSVASAFRDRLFLEYLVRLQIRRVDKPTFELQDLFRILVHHKTIRDVWDIKYTYPFVARLLSKTGNLQVIEYSNMKMLIMTLGTGGDALSLECLESLLRVQSDSQNHLIRAVIEVVMDDNFPEERVQITLKAVCDSEKFQIFEETVREQLKSVKWKETLTQSRLRKVLIAANDIALDFINENKLARARDLIDNAHKLGELFSANNLFSEDTNITSVRKLHEAKLLNAMGLKMERTEAQRVYKQALEILQSLRKTSNPPHRMLAMSREAYSYHLLGKSIYAENAPGNDPKKYYVEKAREISEEVWKEMWGYIHHEEPYDGFIKFYERARESTIYQNLLNTGEEYSKYLNVSKLKNSCLFYVFGTVTKESYGLLKLLEDWDTVYDMGRQEVDPLKTRIRCAVLRKKAGIHSVLSSIAPYRPDSRYYHGKKHLELQIIRFRMLVAQGRYTFQAIRTAEYIDRALNKVYKPDRARQ